MAYLEWKNDLSVGVAGMDAQHQKLVALINQLADAMAAGQGNTVIETVLNDLVEYAKTHFASEERLLSVYHYPEYSMQKVEHAIFEKNLGAFQAQFREGRITLSLQVMQYLREWLLGHIQGRDKAYGPYLNKQGVM